MKKDNNIFEAQDGEEVNEYIQRMIPLKDCYDLTWNDICDNIFDNFGVALSANAVQKRAKRLSQLSSYTDKQFEISNKDDEELTPEQEFIIDSYKLRDERTQINALYRRMSREESIKEIAKDAVSSMLDIKPLRVYNNSVYDSSTEGILLIGDWHFGVEIENNFNGFNLDIAYERVNLLKDKVLDKVGKDKISKLYLLNLGDLIAGNIHLPIRLNSRIDVITQIMQVSELLSEFISELSKYVKVEYYSVVDNHSRIDPNKKEALQLETLARITDWYVSQRLGFELNENTYGPTIANFVTDNGVHVLGVHGDLDKPNNIISKLSNFTHEPIDLLCSAHLHHFHAEESNGTLHIENGSLMGTDEYAFNLRLNSKPSQTLITFDGKNLNSIYKIDLI